MTTPAERADPARQARIAALRADLAIMRAKQSSTTATQAPTPASQPRPPQPQSPQPPAIPADLLADIDRLRAAGLACFVVSVTLTPTTPTPAYQPPREIAAAEIAMLDARDPMRTLHQCQRAYAQRGQPVPQRLVENLRAAARDEAARRRRISRRGA
jgi:hypothetical protein